MLLSRYEIHQFPHPYIPFIFHPYYTLTKQEIETNWHKNIEILYCISGNGYVRCGASCYDFKENDIAVINSDQLHTVGSTHSISYCCFIIGAGFCVENGIAIENLLFQNLIQDPELAQLIHNISIIHKNFNGSDTRSVIHYRYAALGLLCKLCRDYCCAESIPAPSHAHIKKAIMYIRSNFTKKLSLDNISIYVGISKYHLCREFKTLTGSTIIEFINTLRCTEAKRLIEKGMRVSEVAYTCGFDNLSYFSRTFQNIIGHPPSFFAKKLDA